MFAKETKIACLLLSGLLISICFGCQSAYGAVDDADQLVLKREILQDKWEGFWLGQSIANWTGLVTEMDKIGGEGPRGDFYTREDWGKPDQPSIWGQGIPSNLSENIDWVFEDSQNRWGADDDTDLEYMYLYLLDKHETATLSAEQIRNGWLTHIYSDDNTPFINEKGEKENYLWVSNQQAHDLMRQGVLPPATGSKVNNAHFAMIDAQLTTEVFGLLAPGHPQQAIALAELPILTTAREDAQWAAEFYVAMYAIAAGTGKNSFNAKDSMQIAERAREHLPEQSYLAKMYDFVKASYLDGKRWEITRDAVYQRYQVEQQDGYTITSQELYCNGCFAAGINFAASMISWFYGEGDYQKTIKIAVLAGWDSDNPAATWGGLLGFVYGRTILESEFDRTFSDTFWIHRTRGHFPDNGIDTFPEMAKRGIRVTERVITQKLGGQVTPDALILPVSASALTPAIVPDDYPVAQ